MIHIENKNPTEKIKSELKDISCNEGLIIVASANQNWNQFMLTEILNFFVSSKINKKTLVRLFCDNDQYTWDRLPQTSISALNNTHVVHGESIRDQSKAELVLNVATKCIVVSIIHANNASNVMQRFVDMGIAKEILEKRLLATFCIKQD